LRNTKLVKVVVVISLGNKVYDLQHYDATIFE